MVYTTKDITVKFLNGTCLITPYSYEYEYTIEDGDSNDTPKKIKYNI